MGGIAGEIILIPLSYLLGAIPVGYLLVRALYKTDIREHGSGNPGATNVWRTFGKKPGATTLALDILKGVLPVVLARTVFKEQYGLAIACGMAAIVGHNWSVFLKGDGGKGVATSIGVFLALVPIPSLVAIVVFLIVFYFSGHVSMGSMAGAVALVITTFLWPTPWAVRTVAIVASVLLFIRHTANVKRIAAGTEPKVKFR